MTITARFVVCLLSLIMTLPLAAPIRAQDTDTALRELHTLRVLLEKAAMDYQMLKNEGGNPRYEEALADTVARIEDARYSLEEVTVVEGQAETMARASDAMDRFMDLLAENADLIASGGYEDLALVDQMYGAQKEAQMLLNEVYDATAASLEEPVPEIVSRMRELSFIMQRLAASYLEQAASTFGTVSWRSDEKSVDQKAQEFASKLEELEVHSKEAPSINVMVAQVKRRWDFMEQSMLNYKENTVPFLVYRYSNAMVDDLLTVADLYGEPQQPAQPPMPGGGGAEGGAVPLPPGMREGDGEGEAAQ
jgi:nucleotide-binding universal stress UspA family protein